MDEATRSPDPDTHAEAVPIVNPHDRTTDASLPEPTGYRVLVPQLQSASVAVGQRRVRLGGAIAADQGGDVVVLGLPQVPAETPLDEFEVDSATEMRVAVGEIVAASETLDVPVRGVMWLANTESRAIGEAIDRYECDGVVAGVPTGDSHRRRVLAGETSHGLHGNRACDVYLERTPETDYPVDRIMLAVAGGPHSGLATETARRVADQHDATVTAVRVLEPDADDDARESATALLDEVAECLDDDRHETRLVETTDVAEGLVRASNDYDLTVIGAPREGVLERFVFGSVSDSVVHAGSHAVLMVRRGTE